MMFAAAGVQRPQARAKKPVDPNRWTAKRTLGVVGNRIQYRGNIAAGKGMKAALKLNHKSRLAIVNTSTARKQYLSVKDGLRKAMISYNAIPFTLNVPVPSNKNTNQRIKQGLPREQYLAD